MTLYVGSACDQTAAERPAQHDATYVEFKDAEARAQAVGRLPQEGDCA